MLVSTILKKTATVKAFANASLLAACLLTTTMAQAILPTPEPELDDPSSATNSMLMQNATANNGTKAAMANSTLATRTVAAIVKTDAQGQTTLQPVTAATRVSKGDVIEYRTYITNNSQDRVRSMDITMSIPNEVELSGAVMPKAVQASIDNKAFSRMPLKGKINGQLQQIPLQYYKGLRWTIRDLGIGDTDVVQYRAVLK